MAKFEITGPDGARYEVEAPDEATALSAFQQQMGSAPQSNDQRYTQALDAVRQSQFPDFTDDQFAAVANQQFAPSDFNDVTAGAQLFGFDDEIGSALGALGSQVRQWTGGGGPGFGEAYGQYAALNEARRDLGREQLGPLANVGDVVGGFSVLGPARAAGGAVLPATATLTSPQAMTNAVLAGTGLGYVGGFGTTDGDLADRNAGGAVGAGIGTVVGRFGPTVANAAGSAYSNVANLLARNNASQAAGINPGVARYLTNAIEAGGGFTPEGVARMNAAGGQGMIVDAAPNMRTMLDTAIQSSGAAGRTARDAIADRLAIDSDAIRDALDNTLGLPEGIGTARARIASETAGDRGAAYRAADAVPIDYSSEAGYLLDDLLTRVPKSAIDRANTLMKVRGEKSSQILADVADDGTVTFFTKPDVRQIDYITRALNEEAKDGIGAGAMGGQTDIGGSLQELSSNIRTVLGNHIPEYRTALDTAGDAISRSKAVQLGNDILSPSMTMDDVIRQTANLSDAEKQGIHIGLRTKIDNLMARVRRTLGNPDTETREAAQALVNLSSRENRTKIEAAIGPELAGDLFAELDRAGMSFELASSVANNSQTFARTNQQQVVNNMAGGDGVIDTLRRAKPLNAGQRVIQALTGMTDDAVASRADDINNQIVRMLVARGPEAQTNWNTLNTLGNQTYGNGAIAQALSAGIGQAALPSSIASQRYIAGSR